MQLREKLSLFRRALKGLTSWRTRRTRLSLWSRRTAAHRRSRRVRTWAGMHGSSEARIPRLPVVRSGRVGASPSSA